ncbi:fatty acid desaturase 5 [Euphorbia peplus]|nr:fatty acid desaturase 5 [Euphorbia peplus]
MALTTASLIKSKPYTFLPLQRAKPLNNPPSAIPSSDEHNPEIISLRTTYKRESSNLFSYPNEKAQIFQNAAAKSTVTNEIETPSSEIEVPSSEEAELKSYSRILLSDVVVKNKRRGRKWNVVDIATAGIILGVHLLSLFAPFYFTWGAFWVAFGLYFITGLLGITLSFHRNLSHRSFKIPKWLEYSFAYCGAQALQGSPTDWVSTHRYHHQHCDSERDPHSPTAGFWHSHISWLFDTDSIYERCGGTNNVGDLDKQSFYRFISKTYLLHPIALGFLLYALGGMPFLVWGMGVRVVWVYHITWLVNSACHVWGNQSWNTGDLSKNNWWVAILAFGEGWHNNHHAFEYSARQGLEWYQIDMTWYFLSFLQAIGLATDVKLPNESQKQRMASKN